MDLGFNLHSYKWVAMEMMFHPVVILSMWTFSFESAPMA